MKRLKRVPKHWIKREVREDCKGISMYTKYYEGKEYWYSLIPYIMILKYSHTTNENEVRCAALTYEVPQAIVKDGIRYKRQRFVKEVV